MARIRDIPLPHVLDYGQAQRLRFEEFDRIILDDDIDYRWVEDTDHGHVLQAEHDKKIHRGISFEAMFAQSKRMGFRHDRGWYSKRAVKKRLRTDIETITDLSYPARQYIYWQEAFSLEFLRLEANDPKVTRGAVGFEKANTIARIYLTVSNRVKKAADNGRRKRSDRARTIFDAPDQKTLLGWVKKLVNADFDPMIFCKRYARSGNREERLTQEQCRLAGKYAMLYASPTEPSVRQLHSDMEAEIEQINIKRRKQNKSRPRYDKLPLIKPVSYDRLLRQVHLMDEFDIMAGRKGIEVALKHFRPVGDGKWDVLRPMQEVEIDHWTVQLQTLLIWSGQWDKLSKESQKLVRKHARRMVLGVAICRRTHCIAAMILSRTPSVESSIRLYEMAVTEKKKFADGVGAITPWDIAATMDTLVMDGGPAFNNADFRSKMAGLGVEPEYPPGGLPHLRGMVERMFRTIDQKLVMRFEGRTFSNVAAKGEYDSVGRAGITVDELGYALIRYVVDCHHNTPQAALGGETPRACYLRLSKEHGLTPCPDPDLRRNVFGVDIKRTLSASGVRFLGIQYRSEELHKHFMKVKNAELTVRVYAGNLGAISVKIGKKFLTVMAPSEFAFVDAQTWIGAEALLRRRGAHYKKITREIVLEAIAEFGRLAAVGRRRADISDSQISKNALLHAERSIKIFARYPDQVDDTEEAGGDLYAGAIKVGTPAARKAAASKRNRARKPAPPSKAAPAAPAKPARKPARASAKAPKPKKRPTTPSRIPGRHRASGRGHKVTG
jgi:putative transposase